MFMEAGFVAENNLEKFKNFSNVVNHRVPPAATSVTTQSASIQPAEGTKLCKVYASKSNKIKFILNNLFYLVSNDFQEIPSNQLASANAARTSDSANAEQTHEQNNNINNLNLNGNINNININNQIQQNRAPREPTPSEIILIKNRSHSLKSFAASLLLKYFNPEELSQPNVNLYGRNANGLNAEAPNALDQLRVNKIKEVVLSYVDGDESVKNRIWRDCSNAMSKKISDVKKK